MFGYLRETQKHVEKDPIDPVTGICRTSLPDYLNAIYPDINDWIFDKSTGLIDKDTGKKSLRRPDARSEKLKLIVEIDGLPHYQNPDIILRDEISTKFYEDYGYKVVRIPYFIQLSNNAVKTLFDKECNIELFDESHSSMSPELRNTPAYMCPLGIERMNNEFSRFPGQLNVNMKHLKNYESNISGLEFFKKPL